MTRRRLAIGVAAVVLVAVVLKVLTGVGPALPGPKIGSVFGEDDRPPAPQCKASPRRILTPATPKPGAGRWRIEPSSPDTLSELKAATVGGLVYLVGGQGPGGRSVATVTAFDPRTRTFKHVPDLPERVDHALVAGHGGALYVVGGYRDSEPTNDAWRYAPGGGWDKLPALPTARGGLAGGVIGDRLYAVSGAPRTYPEVDARPYSSLEIYDFAAQRWHPGPPIPTARHHTGSTVVGDKLYVAGGRTPRDFSSSAFERFDPSSDRWERLPALPMGAGGVEAVAAAGQFVAMGGDDEAGWIAGRGWVTGATWAFNPESSRWRRLPNLNEPRHAHGAAAAAGRIWVFEGAPCPGFGRSSSTESLPIAGH